MAHLPSFFPPPRQETLTPALAFTVASLQTKGASKGSRRVQSLPWAREELSPGSWEMIVGKDKLWAWKAMRRDDLALRTRSIGQRVSFRNMD